MITDAHVDPPPPREQMRPSAFVLGGLSFVLLVGVPLGIAAIVWGLTTRKLGGKKLALIGLGGILFTALLYGGLFYFGFAQRDGIYDSLRVKLAQSTLNSLVPTIELYKIQHGTYPATLEELRASLPKDSFIYDF
jgi:hypothetical protein